MYDQPDVRQAMTALVTKGQDFFRSVVIEALGDQKAAYAQAAIAGVARLDGPLQDDAVLAIGKIGESRSWRPAEVQQPRRRNPRRSRGQRCRLNCAGDGYRPTPAVPTKPRFQRALGAAQPASLAAPARHRFRDARTTAASRDPARARSAPRWARRAAQRVRLLDWIGRVDAAAVAERCAVVHCSRRSREETLLRHVRRFCQPTKFRREGFRRTLIRCSIS